MIYQLTCINYHHIMDNVAVDTENIQTMEHYMQTFAPAYQLTSTTSIKRF